MGLPKKLTEMQIKFANILVANEGRKTATECAIEAGYDPKSAYQRAYELQNPKFYPLVVQYIGERRSEILKKYDVTYQSHITELGKTRDESRENKAWSAAVNAEVARGKAAGFYNNQHIHLHKNVTQSREENDAELVEALKNYKPIINGQAVDLSQVIDVEVTDEPSPSSKSLPKEKHSDQKKPLRSDHKN